MKKEFKKESGRDIVREKRRKIIKLDKEREGESEREIEKEREKE